MKVAIVEDEKDLAEIYNMKMNLDGISTIVINDSTTALEAIQREKPDLILLDIMMPDMDGFELFEKIRKDKSLCRCKVYIWSNMTQKKDKEKAEKLKVDGYLVKSEFTPSDLSRKVKELLK